MKLLKGECMKKLPKTIYVKREQDGDDSFLIADEDLSGISEAEETIAAGEYVLQRMVKVTNKTQITVV